MATKYAFRSNRIDRSLDAQAIGDRLDELIDEKKEHVTPDEIVAEGRKRQSPLHPAFTWDENEAADKWRRREAKQLVGALHVEKNGKLSKTRAFVYVHHPDHGGKKVLMSARSAMGRVEMKEQLIEAAVKNLRRSLAYWSSAFGGNSELRALSKDVDKLRAKAERTLMAEV